MASPVPDTGLAGRLDHCQSEVAGVPVPAVQLPSLSEAGLSSYTSNSDSEHVVQPSYLCQIAAKLEESTGATECELNEPFVQDCPSTDIHSLIKFSWLTAYRLSC